MAVSRDNGARRRAEKARERLIEELSSALSRIKTLQGLIPICSSCRKIRNDKGYWQQLDEYMKQNTDAELSHGLCNECIRKLYPPYAGRVLDKPEEVPRLGSRVRTTFAPWARRRFPGLSRVSPSARESTS